jgi:flagellar basal body L-ring protein FlgH
VVSAVAFSLFAASVAGAIGTTVHYSQSRVYPEEAHTRQPIRAIVTITRHSAKVPRPHANTAIIQARWQAEGIEHVDIFRSQRAVTVGDQIDIWASESRRRLQLPRP